MPSRRDRPALDAVQRHAVPLARSADHDRALIELLGGARFVLLGEASHGTTSSTASGPRSRGG